MPEKTVDYQIVLKKNTSGDKTFNRPTVYEIAVLIVNGSDPNNKNSYRQNMLRNKDDTMSTINQCNMAYDPLQYVLLFPYGDYGWSPGAFSFNINNNQLNEAMLALDTDRTHINVDGDVEGGQSDGNSVNNLFVTITCNTQWKEIQDELSPNETANDRSDLICKVFNLKRKVCFSLKM
jgi:hypothetical protein